MPSAAKDEFEVRCDTQFSNFPPTAHNSDNAAPDSSHDPVAQSKDSFFHQFAEFTTFHGVRLVSESASIRRVAWIFILLFATGTLLYQTGNSVQLYLSRPVSYNSKQDYTTSLKFPAITICNQNSFRISQAWRSNLYDTVEHVFGGVRRSNRTLRSDESVYDMMVAMRHRREDLILHCTWNERENCHDDELKETLMENGMCYTLNWNSRNSRFATMTGSTSGFNMVLNIEQYEFMRTRSLTAGINLYIHDQDVTPKEAISIPPGMKAFLRVTAHQVELLEPPYGVCSNLKLEHHEQYSLVSCENECREYHLLAKCHCHMGTIPSLRNASEKLCSVELYSSCVLPTLRSLERCRCPLECKHKHYSTFVSFSEISTFDVDEAIKYLTKETPRRLAAAREVFYRVNADKKVVTMNETLLPFLKTFKKVQAALKDIEKGQKVLETKLRYKMKEFKIRFDFHSYILERTVFSVKNNWWRGWFVAKERNLNYIASDYVKLYSLMKIAFDREIGQKISAQRLEIYRGLVLLSCYEKMEILSTSLRNISRVHNGFKKPSKLLQYLITNFRYYDHLFIPKDIICHNMKTENKTMRVLRKTINLYQTTLQKITKILEDHDRNAVSKSQLQLKMYLDKFLYFSRRINYHLYLYEDRIVETALKLIEEKYENYNEHYKDLNTAFDKTLQTLNGFGAKVRKLTKMFGSSGTELIRLVEKYAYNFTLTSNNLTNIFTFFRGRDGTKLDAFLLLAGDVAIHHLNIYQTLWQFDERLRVLADMIWDKSTTTFYRKLRKDVQKFCSGKDINSTLSKLLKIWAEKFGTEFSCTHVRKMTNSDWMSYGKWSVFRHFNKVMREWTSLNDKSNKLTMLQEDMTTDLRRLHNFEDIFMDGNEISKKFVKDNFIELQVYYEELASVHLIQTSSYSLTQLWSDIGGNFGLLLGASLLSVLEIFDFCFLWIWKKR